MILDLLSHSAVWLATYALHSTLLLTMTWVLTRSARLKSPRIAETLWRTALFGAIVTASVHTFFGAPLWHTPLPHLEASAHAPTRLDAAAEVAPSPVPVVLREMPILGARSVEAPAAVAPASSFRPPNPAWLLVLWPLGAGFGWWRRRRGRRRLGRSLRARQGSACGELRTLLDHLGAEAGVARPIRLTLSPALSSPIAFGILSPEICLPTRAPAELTPSLLEAMLAHEVAHVARRDAAWLCAYRVVTTLLFFQPLNHVATRKLHDTAELLCDAWAAREEDRRLALARCLTAVADWVLERPAPQGVSAMALRPSLLGRRVHRLLAAAPASPTRRRGIVLLTAVLPTVLVLALAPGIAGPASIAGLVSDTSPVISSGGGVLVVLDRELEGLAGEMAEVRRLLVEAGRPELAQRLERRQRALEAKRNELEIDHFDLPRSERDEP